jgi:hypothetical protein
METSKYSRKRGRLPSPGDQPPSKTTYKCLACIDFIRGDRLTEHYRSKVDFKILSEISLLSPDLAKQKVVELNDTIDPNVKIHTLYFYQNKLSEDNIPDYKQHKTQVLKLTPFQQCSQARKKVKDSGNQIDIASHSTSFELEDDTFSEEEIELPEDGSEAGSTSHDFLTPPPSSTPDQEDSAFQSEKNVYEEVLRAMKDIMIGSEVTKEIENISDKIAEKVVLKTKEMSDEMKDELPLTDGWIEGDDCFYCKSCLKHRQSSDVPKQFFKHRVANFGFISKTGDALHVF